MRIIFLFTFTIYGFLLAENPDSTIRLLGKNKSIILNASLKFCINPLYLASIIFAERELNHDWKDNALDILLARTGHNSSIGFCQIKMKTAYWVEKQLNDSLSQFYPGKQYAKILGLSKSPATIINKLQSDSLNIFYAAAYLRIILSFWAGQGFPIDNRPDIIGTLYSTGLFYGGKIRPPNEHPKANYFGKKVHQILQEKSEYNSLNKILQLDD